MAYLLIPTQVLEDRLSALLRQRKMEQRQELDLARTRKPELTAAERKEAEEIARVKGMHQANAFANRIYDARRREMMDKVRELKKRTVVNIHDVLLEALEVGLAELDRRESEKTKAASVPVESGR